MKPAKFSNTDMGFCYGLMANVFGPFDFDCLRAVSAFCKRSSRVRDFPPAWEAAPMFNENATEFPLCVLNLFLNTDSRRSHTDRNPISSLVGNNILYSLPLPEGMSTDRRCAFRAVVKILGAARNVASSDPAGVISICRMP